MGVEAAAVVESDIANLLAGKSYEHLVTLQRQIQAKLASNEPLDVEYWEGLLKKVLVYKAQSKLKVHHEVVVQNRLEQLRKRQRDEALRAQQELLAGAAAALSLNKVAPATEQEKLAEKAEPYHRSMSPQPIDITKLSYEERQIDIITAAEDRRNLIERRRAVKTSQFVVKPTAPVPDIPEKAEAPIDADFASEAMFRAEAEKDMDEEEEFFNVEESLPNQETYSWEDKYRPRKPRYLNKVHTGYEWNKYNQTHYDTDNPPPKVVQGYKFNIFYPDLIEGAKTPSYVKIKEPGNDETMVLRFTAGPPYEDIAFRIVNRDWEFSHKKGFKCTFDRGCLSLWFNFRRDYYRK